MRKLLEALLIELVGRCERCTASDVLLCNKGEVMCYSCWDEEIETQ